MLQLLIFFSLFISMLGLMSCVYNNYTRRKKSRTLKIDEVVQSWNNSHTFREYGIFCYLAKDSSFLRIGVRRGVTLKNFDARIQISRKISRLHLNNLYQLQPKSQKLEKSKVIVNLDESTTGLTETQNTSKRRTTHLDTRRFMKIHARNLQSDNFKHLAKFMKNPANSRNINLEEMIISAYHTDEDKKKAEKSHQNFIRNFSRKTMKLGSSHYLD